MKGRERCNADERPVINYRGVRPGWSEKHGWRFRAVIEISGHRKYGTWRATQEHAADDYLDMRERRHAIPVPDLTLEQAIAKVADQARARGVPESTVKVLCGSHGRYLMQFWRPTAPMKELGRDELLWFVREARAAGRHPNTLIEKDLPLMGRCYAAAGVDNPVPRVREELRQVLKYVPPDMSFFTPDEIRDVIQRMRTGVFRRTEIGCQNKDCRARLTDIMEDREGDQLRRCPRCRTEFTLRTRRTGQPVAMRTRDADADLVQFLAMTGVRAGELGRIRVRDIDWKRRQIRVESKDRGHPRFLDIVDAIEPIVRRWEAAARRRGGRAQLALLVPDSETQITNMSRRWKGRLGEPRLCGRTLRHTFGTALFSAGASAAEVMRFMGHRHLGTTTRYSHEVTDNRVPVLNRLAHAVCGERSEADG